MVLAGLVLALTAIVYDPTWSPDGGRLAYVRADGSAGRIYVVGADGAGRRAVTPSVPAPSSLSWSPDGRALAYVSDGEIWRVDLASGRRVDLTPGGPHYYEQASWSSDGSEIAFVAAAEPFRSWDVLAVPSGGGTPRKLVDSARRPRYEPHGSRLLVSSPPRVVDPATGAALASAAGGTYATWSPRGGAFSYYDGGAIHVAVPGGSDTVARRTRRAVAAPVLSPHARRLAYVAGRRVLLLDRRSGKVRELPRGDSANDTPAWSTVGLAYVASGPCGRRSEIVLVRADGSSPRMLAAAC